MRDIAVSFEHLEDAEIAAYLSGTLSAAERDALEAHLAECRACRTEVTSARKLLRTQPVQPRRVLVASLAAAAVLAGVLLVPRGLSGPLTDPDRSAEPGAAPALRAVAPGDRAAVRRDSIRFTWRSEPGDLLYRLTITTASGEAVWNRDTNDTTVILPDSLRLAAGARYFWYVDALDASGISITTGPRSMRIAP
jgi:anti-sigma factor RsiW